VVIDTCRFDRMSLFGYELPTTPNLEKLGAQAVIFEQAVSHVPQTLPSVSTILTSTPPREHGVRVNGLFRLPEASETLAEVLRRNGYATAGVVSAFPLDARFGISQGFDSYDADFRESILTRTRREGFAFQGTRVLDFEQRADEATNKAVTWLKAATGKEPHRRFFLLVHYFDPHYPYAPPAERVDLTGYDGELAFADAEIGRLLTAIREMGLLDQTLVVVVGDHGELLDPKRPRARHAGYLEDAVLRVPLLMRLPGALPSGRRIAGQVALLDIAPTILDLLGIPAPPQFRGRSLVPLVEGEGAAAEEKVYFETLYWALEEKRGLSRYGVRTPKLKYILNVQATAATSIPREELYDLQKDPGEKENLLADPAAATTYSEQLEPLRRGVSARVEDKGAGQRHTLSREDEERLRSLGYLGE
jgi:arylsulfatase A-like enzyme